VTDLALINLGCGNLGSVGLAFERLGLAPDITDDAGIIAQARRVVLPGVGAAGFAMERIRALGLQPVLANLTQPLLGICLGMQLLFERSAEEDVACLGLLPGTVRKLKAAPGRPVPHMGWSRLDVTAPDIGLSNRDYVYFAHSYVCPEGPQIAAAARYGHAIPAAVRHRNLWGAQFHPEKSAAPGRRFLEAFLSA
jgi:glutamine amidotransferase